MKLAIILLFLFSLFFLSSTVHAEGGCPSGMIPYSGTDLSSCGPIPPEYYKNSQRPVTPTMRWVSMWGAIATDAEVGSLGTVTNASSKEQAESLAIADCKSKGGSQCEVQAAYDNECVAMVVGDKLFDIAADATLDKAIKTATRTCQKGNTNCHVYYSACSLPERIQ